MKKKYLIILVLLIVSILYLFQGLDSDTFSFFIGKRFSKLILMILVGTTIGISSVIFQTITNNRILTPGVLGVDSIYMFFNLLLLYFAKDLSIFSTHYYLYFFFVTILTLGSSFILYKIIFGKENRRVDEIILIGVVFGTLLKGISSFFQIMLDPNQFSLLQDLSFASINNTDVNLIYLTAPILIAICFIVVKQFHVLDIMLLGKDQSINLGIDYDKKVKLLFCIVITLTSITTALIGPLVFFGVAIVNIAREIVISYRHKELVLFTSILGTFILILGQFIIERLLNMAVPIGVLIGFFSGIYFFILLIKENKNV